MKKGRLYIVGWVLDELFMKKKIAILYGVFLSLYFEGYIMKNIVKFNF